MDAVSCSSRLLSSSPSLLIIPESSTSTRNRNSRSAVSTVRSAISDSDFRIRYKSTRAESRGVVRRVSDGTAESQDDRPSQLTIPRNDKVVLWQGVSKTGMACLATTILATATCGDGLAAVEAFTPVSDESSNFMFVIVCIGEAIALTGAAVGGVLARQRKLELEKINAQLRQINLNLRRQSRVESYAPNLTYAPVGSGRMTDSQVKADPVREELMQRLKAGKRWLREKLPANAFEEFQKALVLAQQLKDTAEQKKAARGLGASCQRQGKYQEAVKYHSLVLNISESTKEGSGNTEAYGAIADCYTELGDLETAGKYYDQYIERLENDDMV